MKEERYNGLFITNSRFESGSVSAEVKFESQVGMICEFATTDFANLPNWLYCDGRMLEAAKYPFLFAKIGYQFGGSGEGFAIPDLRGLVVACASSGEPIGKKEGAKTHVLTVQEMPSHSHLCATWNGVSGQYETAYTIGGYDYGVQAPPTTSVGGNAAHNNMQPTIYLAKFIYAL